MKFKLDENIPHQLSRIIGDLGYDVQTVLEENLGGYPDNVVWKSAQEEGRFFITQDLDFSDIRRFQPGAHPGIMIVRLGNPSRKRIIERIRLVFTREEVENMHHCFVVITERKIRIRRP